MLPIGRLLLTEQAAALLSLLLFVALLIVALATDPSLRRVAAAMKVFGAALARYLVRRLRGEGRRAGPIEWRLAFERLGPTYIKLGQLIASSTSLFPDRYVQEFRLCLDRVPPEPWQDVERTLVESFGRPVHEVFRSVSREPLASASIAQVYAAEGIDDGGARAELVIKVQRRGLPALVGADLRILLGGARVMQRIPHVRNANPLGVVQEFGRTIREELDFIAEAANMDEFNRIMNELGRSDVCAPRPVHSLCTATVLTMERFRGIQIDDLDALKQKGYEAQEIEEKLIAGLHAWFQSMIRYGFFHGDVHAGNLLLLEDGRIGFLDFGIIGRFSKERRRQIADYIVAFAMQDFHALAAVMVRMGVLDEAAGRGDADALARDLKDAYGPLFGRSLREIDYGEILPKIIRVSRRHGTRLPDEFVLVTRQLIYFDRYAKLLAPSLNVFSDPRLVMTIGAELAHISQI